MTDDLTTLGPTSNRTWEDSGYRTSRLVARDGRILATVERGSIRTDEFHVVVYGRGHIGTYNTMDNGKRAAERAVTGVPA